MYNCLIILKQVSHRLRMKAELGLSEACEGRDSKSYRDEREKELIRGVS